jgi:hypothetical protein
MDPVGLLISAIGALLFFAARSEWSWFWGHYKARFIVRIMGQQGARMFYGMIGVALIVLGILIATGVL